MPSTLRPPGLNAPYHFVAYPSPFSVQHTTPRTRLYICDVPLILVLLPLPCVQFHFPVLCTTLTPPEPVAPSTSAPRCRPRIARPLNQPVARSADLDCDGAMYNIITHFAPAFRPSLFYTSPTPTTPVEILRYEPLSSPVDEVAIGHGRYIHIVPATSARET